MIMTDKESMTAKKTCVARTSVAYTMRGIVCAPGGIAVFFVFYIQSPLSTLLLSVEGGNRLSVTSVLSVTAAERSVSYEHHIEHQTASL